FRVAVARPAHRRPLSPYTTLFRVPQLVVRDIGVCQGERYGIVPGIDVARRVDRDPRSLLQDHDLHVLLRDPAPDRGRVRGAGRLNRNTSKCSLAPDDGPAGQG